jgi:signal transduction histidine kinase/ActR/RegA family two-component response regulator
VAQVGSFDQIYRIARPDGSECWIHDRGRPIYDAEGKICRLVGIAADVTKEHKLEEQFRQAQKMEAIGTLAGGIAHDFNNILTAISGYTELAITASADNPKARGFLDSIAQAGARAADLVRQILTFSRQQEQQLRPIQLREVVEEALKLLRSTIPATIQFKTSYDPQVPTVLADASQIHQVLLNLGTNAWHAMRDQAGCLEVRLESFEVDIHLAEVQPRLRPGRYLRLSISDTGKGMARSTVDRIFEPFFTTKAPGEGTGLGLSVVHGIMQSHGGSIIVYSQPGAGTVFHLYFPAYLGKDSKASLPADPVPRGGGARILYVDDEEPLARLGQMNLERLDYSVEVQTNVVKALALVQANPNRYDLVITDYSMPGMTGIDFAARLLKLRADFPIILTTGYAANLTAERVGALGIRGLLLKPHTGHALGLAVHRALAREKLE